MFIENTPKNKILNVYIYVFYFAIKFILPNHKISIIE